MNIPDAVWISTVVLLVLTWKMVRCRRQQRAEFRRSEWARVLVRLRAIRWTPRKGNK